MDKTCENCKHYVLRNSGEHGCWNKKSEYFGENPKNEHSCKDWEAVSNG